MQRRGDDSIRGRIARARARTGARGRSGSAPVRSTTPVRPMAPRRRVPRREIQARRQRMLRWGVAAAGLLTIIILAGGLIYEYVVKPNQTLATVGSATISRQDYWKSRANDLYEQALQYQDFAQFVGADQQGQYAAIAQQSLAQIPDVWGSTEVDRVSLEKMIEDQIYLQGLDDFGLEISEEEIDTFALNRFAPPGAPLIPSTPTPTLTAERAAIATSTAASLLATPFATPIAGVSANGTPVGTPLAAAPTTPAATPSAAEARATAEAGFAQFEENLFDLAHLSRQDYQRLVAAPALARQKINTTLSAMVGQSAPQVQAAHILLPTQEAAEAARARVTEGGEDFAAVAREVSIDQGTAANGGELGWFTREEMVAPFAEAAFTLEPGTISEPVETEFGWHVIRVTESDPERPLTDLQINKLQQAAIERWLEEQRTEIPVSSTSPPTPTPFTREFVPPAGAPPLPPPTPLPLPGTPSAPPLAIPADGTPSG